MSVWILKSPFSAEEEKHLAAHTKLALPFEGLPDLSRVNSEETMRLLLVSRTPDAAPETIARQADMHWKRLSQLALGDLMVLPLSYGKIALAEVIKRYGYDGSHYAEVHWLEMAIPRRKLAALGGLLRNVNGMQLLENSDARKAIYALLRRPYNRFAKWRWLLGVVILMQAIVMLVGMLKPS